MGPLLILYALSVQQVWAHCLLAARRFADVFYKHCIVVYFWHPLILPCLSHDAS